MADPFVVAPLEARFHKGANAESAAGGHLVVQAFTVTGNDFSTGDGVSPTIRAGADRQNTTPMVVVPVQDGRGMEKSQNGLGVGEPGDPMYTLDTTGAQSVAYEVSVWWNGSDLADTLTTTSNAQLMPDKNRMQVVVQSMNGDVAGTLDANYGKGPGERSGVERDVVAQQVVVPCNVDGADVAPTLRGFGHGWQGQHNTTNAVWVYDGYNQRLADDGVTGSMRTRFDSSDFVAYPEPVLFEPMSLREENWVGRDTKNALRAEASKSSHAVVSAWPLNERGREDGSRLEMGEEGVYNTLAAGDGSSSRRQLVLAEERHTQTEESMTPANNLVVRRLTPLECELLMGWEPGWTAEGVEPDGTVVRMADTHRYRMCGNGVVSNVGEWIARRYLKALSDSALDVEGSSVPRPEVEGSAG